MTSSGYEKTDQLNVEIWSDYAEEMEIFSLWRKISLRKKGECYKEWRITRFIGLWIVNK